jgi:hypothetical protein
MKAELPGAVALETYVRKHPIKAGTMRSPGRDRRSSSN